ncbi:MAG: saccharopine dehydrogenase family protein [Solirubrobacteraceae bacterium]|nr:MAG: saccharopine dehydrogenase [Solirubrobacterales bacterium]
MPAEREHDIVLFGATGFTGGLTAEYLAEHAPETTGWALAGRSPEKLRGVRERLAAINPHCAEIELLHADVNDPASLREVAANARVVITTVGPYIEYGEPLVAACADAGTDYVDLTGEPEFVDLMWLCHHARATESGARIVHCCGFDSIPHDLGAYFTVQQLPQDAALRVEGFVRAGGRLSGGTFHTAVTGFSRARQYAKVSGERRRAEPRPIGRRARAVMPKPHRESAFGGWALPMPTIDPQVVVRSARALERYGPDFSYSHSLLLDRLPAAIGLVGGIAGVFTLAQLPPTRKWLLGRIEPGSGPTPEQRAKSWFKVRFRGTGGDRRVVTEVAGGDPGYGETARMLAESALCLAHDDLPASAGQVTTATAMGDALLGRLQRIGITFSVLES